MFNIDLPSGRKVVMRLITYRDRQEALRIFKSTQNPGYTIDEYLASMSIVAIDGKDMTVDLVTDPIERMDSWELKDTQYFLEVFMVINSLDEKMRQEAAEQAKKLLGGSPAPTGKGKAA